MTDETSLLIKLINEDKTLNEITNILNLSKRQLFQRMFMLKQSGYLIDKKYYYNGDIKYYFDNPFIQKNPKSLQILSSSNLSSIRIVVDSDPHFGNVDDCLRCADLKVEHCIKENINLTFLLGDIFEGVIKGTQSVQKYNSPEEQIQQFLKKYPMPNNIITAAVLGNHDASFWIDAGIDIKTILNNRRHDIIPIGYESSEIIIDNFKFCLIHPIDRINYNKNLNSSKYKIVLRGHSHRFKIETSPHSLYIYAPSSSKIKNGGNFLGTGIPSFLDIEFLINDKAITKAIVNQYIMIDNQLVKIGETEANVYIQSLSKEQNEIQEKTISPKFSTCFEDINEILEPQQLQGPVKKLTPFAGTKNDQYRGLSQLDKFNKRFEQ